ncbi:MAG: Asp-tRNA(Asn)/Glu-tRNA(Gln) amidotransferase subunit GatB [Alphaproteobacteria bacterium]|nr:Asp-tRNA(Asn)/Glu-tRNA(Gln) amidotransferase subunit GatB [Alphaproteobacteria bacterium]MDE1931433.1 Asp-tRNA(Asn)/Glu-tRNA(Gln) amidotransferase subunit GatB [Alphaproteobacteria bacterium]
MSNLVKGHSGDWEVVIGLEVHAQVISKAKLFSGAATEFGAEPNTQVSTVDAAFPGMLPVLNRFCVEQAVKTGLGLDAQINLQSVFDRKNYFYPDLPAGYQISQFSRPIVGKGKIVLDMPDGTAREVGITRLHLEQDAGKSLHDQHPSKTYVDLNRAGVALMEIVSEPDLRTAEEAGAYLRKLRAILRYLGTCDANMEEGNMRCDCNVSVRKPGGALGTRCEIKNVNSIRFVMQAIDYEARRQIGVIEDGGKVVQETRLFDSGKGVTRSMRSKEESHDYRYFPDPDLLPVTLDPVWLAKLKADLPELPDAKKARFMRDYDLSTSQASALVAEKETADAFEELQGKVSKTVSISATATANTVINVVSFIAGERGVSPAQFIGANDVPGVLILQQRNVISGRMVKEVLEGIADSKQSAEVFVAEKGLKQVTDIGAIDAAIDAVLAKEPDKVADYRGGKEKLLAYFVGQVMKATQGKANPALVNELLRKKLAG